jgi:hypothetical protein
MDVTEQIRHYSILYGASDNTNPASIAAAKKLNYAEGASMQKPSLEQVSLIPSTVNYQDAVGLFGVENHFVKVTVKLLNPTSICFPENTYLCAIFSEEIVDPNDPYTAANTGSTPGQAYINEFADTEDDGSCSSSGVICVNTYEPANLLGNIIPSLNSPRVSVKLDNLKTGNQYTDDWLDVRLYTKDRMEHPYDLMYVRPNDYFYVGFHARNTKRLPYNVNLTVGEQYIDETEVEDRRYLMQLIR